MTIQHESPANRPAVRWPDEVENVLGGDLAVALAHITPASGVILTPVTNYGLHDREAATVSVLSSLGAWKKLERIRANPNVALVYHAREHGYSNRQEYVLVQGRARFCLRPDHAWLESIEPNWVRFMGPRRLGPVWDRWMRVYHWERVAVTVDVHRVTVWPDLACQGLPTTHGAERPADPPAPQTAPRNGTAPRIDQRRAASKVARLPHTLLGWVGADGFPQVVPATVAGSGPAGITLEVPDGAVPAGGRRAGLTAHWFSPGVLGQTQHVFTGWLDADPARARVQYAPHTHAGYRLPPSRLLYRTFVGGFTRVGLRAAKRAGFLDTP